MTGYHSHGTLCALISKYLKEQAPGVWFFRPMNMGYGRAGIPDFIVCRHGQFVALEVKVGRDTLEPWQSREVQAIQAAGGAALVVRELADVVRIMEA